MKKILIIASICLLGGLTETFAQARIGGGFAYGTEVEEFGLNLNGEFFLKNNLAIGPEFTYFFAENDVSWWTLDADGHFYFSGSSAASVYGLAGLNLTTFDSGFPNADADTELGINLGIGANFDINSVVLPFAQFKFVISDYDQAVLSFGVRVGI